MVRVIGLTGGIASGKSTASNILKELGAVIIDADKVSRKVVEKGEPALEGITEYFGKEILCENGKLNRKKLGNIIFNNKTSIKKLNEITHPYIIKEIINEINWHKKTHNNSVIILDAALLIEMNLTYLVEEVWLISIPEEIQLNRLIKRDNISVEDAKQRIKSQMSLEDKKKFAHRIIENSKNVIYLKEQLEKNLKEVI